MPFEAHRYYLIHLIDDCLELFETDSDFKHFHLDGQTVPIEDYLEIKPQNLEKIKKYVQEGKLSAGPWYVLQDEFLTSSESNLRNLLVGMHFAKQLGHVMPVGYFPDSFGNVGQMPRILKQAGMQAIAFGRGVKATGNLQTADKNGLTAYSELIWQSPDGSALPAAFFANWYNNGQEIAEDGNKAYWDNVLQSAEKYASCDELLVLNGCDHQPVQKNLAKAIRAAKENYPDYEFSHVGFEEYTNRMIKNMPKDVSTVRGELTSKFSDGWVTLINTASSLIDLKVMNRECEILLESIAEPLSVMAAALGKNDTAELIVFAWKKLMQNHPHDSICCCSCDEVHEEMRNRFNKSRQAAERTAHENLLYLAKHMESNIRGGCIASFAVVNTYGKEKSGLVNMNVDVQRMYGIPKLRTSGFEIEKSLYRGEYELVDADGNAVSCTFGKPYTRFDYDLPADRFREPYFAETVPISFEAESVPAFGHKVFGIRRKAKKSDLKNSLIHAQNSMENEFLKVEIQENGTIVLTDKQTGNTFKNLLELEDAGDIGSEYTFVPAKDDTPILSGENNAEIELVRDEEFAAEYKITVTVRIPKEADESAKYERRLYVPLQKRKAPRGKDYIEMPVTFNVVLAKNAKRVDVTCSFHNKAKDHRLRVLFPSGAKCQTHKAESVFEAPERNNVHEKEWTYPSGCDRTHGFVMLKDEKGGIAVSGKGLYEYEILNNDTIAITLLRATAELGDWGVFPTKLSQMQKELSLSFSIISFANEAEVYDESGAFMVPLQTVQITEKEEKAAFKENFVSWSGADLRLTALKCAMAGEGYAMRYVNFSSEMRTLTVKKTDFVDKLFRSNVLEERKKEIYAENNTFRIEIKPFEIATFLVQSK